jgi:hypothetical protein
MLSMIEITQVSSIVLILALLVIVVGANWLAELIGDRAYGWFLCALLVGLGVAIAIWG